MPGARRDEYIYNLKPEDYYQGPGINDYDPKEGMVWMFGIGIKKRGKKMAHLQSSVFKLSKDLIDSIHEEGIVAYTS